MFGSLKVHLTVQVVDLFHLDESSRPCSASSRDGGHQVLVQQHVLVPEHDVVGGEGRAVRPLGALAQLDRPVLKSADGVTLSASFISIVAPSGEKRTSAS